MSPPLFVASNGQQTGPFTADQIRQMLAGGSLKSSDLAWREGMAEWRPLAEVLPSAGAALTGMAVPLAAAAAGGSAAKWGLGAGAAVLVLALGGVGANVKTYTDSGVPNGSYVYHVKAVNTTTGRSSAWSNQISVTVGSTKGPK